MTVEKKKPNGMMAKLVIGAVAFIFAGLLTMVALTQNTANNFEDKIESKVEDYAYPNVKGCVLENKLENMDNKIELIYQEVVINRD